MKWSLHFELYVEEVEPNLRAQILAESVLIIVSTVRRCTSFQAVFNLSFRFGCCCKAFVNSRVVWFLLSGPWVDEQACTAHWEQTMKWTKNLWILLSFKGRVHIHVKLSWNHSPLEPTWLLYFADMRCPSLIPGCLWKPYRLQACVYATDLTLNVDCWWQSGPKSVIWPRIICTEVSTEHKSTFVPKATCTRNNPRKRSS